MRSLRELPLVHKLLLIMMATSGVALLVACSFFLGYDIITFRRHMVDHLKSVSEITGANSTAALTYNDPHSAALVLDAFQSEPHVLGAAIYGKDGQIFASYRRHASPPGSSRSSPPRLLHWATASIPTA